MQRLLTIFLLTALFLFAPTIFSANKILLPKPTFNNTFPLDKALQQRRSVRDYTAEKITTDQLSQLLWAADGITNSKKGSRTAPSAWGFYPISLFVVKQNGVWQYDVKKHALVLVRKGDLRKDLYRAAYEQKQVALAPLTIIITGQYGKIAHRAGPANAKRYTLMEAGHIAQNLLLEATALGLGAVPMAGFKGKEVKTALGIAKTQDIIYLIPVGHKKP